MRRFGAVRILAVIAAMALAAAACTGETTTPDGSATSGGGAPVDTNFTMAYHSEVMVSWDPSDSYSNEVIAMHNMYETLTRYDSETQEVVPLLADLVGVERGRNGVDVHAPRRRHVPLGSRDDLGGREGVDRADDGDRRRRRLHLGPREEDRDAGPDDGDVQAEVLGPAGSGGLGELRGVHLRHAGGRRSGPRGVVRRGERGGHGAVHAGHLGRGRGRRAPPEGLSRLLGNMGRDPLRERDLPRRAAGDDRRAAAAFRAGDVGRAAEPTAVGHLPGRSEHDDDEHPVVADAARDVEHRGRPPRRPEGAAGASSRASTTKA